MSRDPLVLYLFVLALQLATGCISAERAATNLVEMQHELGRRTVLSESAWPEVI